EGSLRATLVCGLTRSAAQRPGIDKKNTGRGPCRGPVGYSLGWTSAIPTEAQCNAEVHGVHPRLALDSTDRDRAMPYVDDAAFGDIRHFAVAVVARAEVDRDRQAAAADRDHHATAQAPLEDGVVEVRIACKVLAAVVAPDARRRRKVREAHRRVRVRADRS